MTLGKTSGCSQLECDNEFTSCDANGVNRVTGTPSFTGFSGGVHFAVTIRNRRMNRGGKARRERLIWFRHLTSNKILLS